MRQTALLAADDPPAVELVNGHGTGNVLLVCDHASNRIPASLATLGLGEDELTSHIGWDAGAAAVARDLALRLDAPLLLSNYSRLVIDCNRWPGHREAVPVRSAGVTVPGNANLTAEEILARRQSLFDPYHAGIGALLSDPARDVAFLLSIHSFAPALGGVDRPWPIGVCYQRDAPQAKPAVAALARKLRVTLSDRIEAPVGDNEPYEVERDVDYTIPFHAEQHGVPGLMLEIRQNEIEHAAAAARWGALIAECWLA